MIPSLDTQGGQVRISSVPKKSHYKKGDSLIISCQEDMPKSAEYDFIINHPESLKQINAGDILKIGFDGLTAKVLKLEESSRTLHSIVLSSGNIGVNKAIDVSNKSINLAPLTCLDKLAFAECKDKKIQSIFLSFCNSRDDIRSAKREFGSRSGLDCSEIEFIAKIETKSGVHNLPEICDEADGILVDRGDLSREISIAEIPSVVGDIIQYCRAVSIPTYIATNVLDCMMRASLLKVGDFRHISFLKSGVSGLVLAAEAAIGITQSTQHWY